MLVVCIIQLARLARDTVSEMVAWLPVESFCERERKTERKIQSVITVWTISVKVIPMYPVRPLARLFFLALGNARATYRAMYRLGCTSCYRWIVFLTKLLYS